MGDYYRYWGKAGREEGKEPGYHLLPYHCLDVAATGQELLRQRPAEWRKLAAMCGMEPEEFRQWAVFFLALHDLGKFSFNFQAKRPDLLRWLQPELQRQPLEVGGHDALGWLIWDRMVRAQLVERGVLPTSQSRWSIPIAQQMADRWMRAMCGHHGKPVNASRLPTLEDHFTDVDQAAARGFASQLMALLLPDTDSFPLSEEVPFQRASWYLAGFAVLADWIGSNEHYFSWQIENMPLDRYWEEIAEPEASRAVYDSGMVPAVPEHDLGYEDLLGKTAWQPTPMQALAQSQPLSPWPQLLIVEDVTGSGKTEAALMLAHRLMQAHELSGLYFALPTMATANAMFERMMDACRNFYTPDSRPSLVLAHGARQLSESFSALMATPPAEEDKSGDVETASATCNRWLADHRKKALLAEIGVGTVDQALLGILRARHQSLRLYGLMQKVLIVDEVHACDSYMNRLLQTLLHFHAAAGGSAILLSATLPRSQRQALVNAFNEGLGLATAPKLQEETSFPLLTRTGMEPAEEVAVTSRPEVCRSIKVKRLGSENEAIEVLRQAANDGLCACWVRNTVVDAIAACEQLREICPEAEVMLFHARYAMQDRLDTEKEVLACFGEQSNAAQRSGRIVVATQVVEQSLDVDFDVMVTDLAPIDLIIQRAGRLHRHCRDTRGNRITGADQRSHPVLHLLAPPADSRADGDWCGRMFDKGQYVYPDHGRLWLSVRLLEEKGGFTMPDDARALIEGVYGADPDSLPKGLQQSSWQAQGSRQADRGIADANVLELLDGYGDGEKPWWDDEVTPTRLGDESRTCYLARWDGRTLRPWIDHGEHRWQRSALQVRARMLAEILPGDEITEKDLEACCRQLPDKGKWSLLLPLRSEGNGWRSDGLNAKGESVRVQYNRTTGLEVVK
jgi:CRISPR-associated endonuclease/helicase Cas3